MITIEALKEWLVYQTESGKFLWLKQASSRAIEGNEAGCIHSNGYRYIKLKGIQYQQSKLAWGDTSKHDNNGVHSHLKDLAKRVATPTQYRKAADGLS